MHIELYHDGDRIHSFNSQETFLVGDIVQFREDSESYRVISRNIVIHHPGGINQILLKLHLEHYIEEGS